MTMPTTSTAAPVAPANALTGKRRIAFASFVDENYLPGFLTLLRSLALSNPNVCEDFLVLHDGLRPDSVAKIRALHPRTDFRRVEADHYDTYAKGDQDNYLVRKAYFILDVFRVRDYDTVITLDTDMVVLDDLGELLRLREGLAAVPQFFYGQHKLNSGLLVIQREYLTDTFCAELDRVGRAGSYELDKHDQGILNAVLDGDFIHLDARYNFVKRRLSGDLPVPEDTAILHFTGRHKPWQGGEAGYGEAEARWHEFDLPDAEFHAAYLAAGGTKHHDLLVHYGTPHVKRTGDLESARKVAAAHILAGEYQEAVDLLGPLRIPVDESWPHEVLGHALMSVSRYDEARTQLQLAASAPNRAATAYGRLAQIAWIHGDDEGASRLALQGLGVDPTHRSNRLMHLRTTGLTRPAEGPASGQLAHVAFYMERQGNAGDKLLPESVRLAFGQDTGPGRWHSVHAHRLFDEAALERVNARRGLVIGGGGLFIPDTAPNGNSGWQWNVSDELLGRIDVPVMVYAVGFNAFDGQAYGHGRKRFLSSLRKLVETSAFFGLRNHGSIEKVRDLLPPELQDKVRFQPCPTTVTRQLVEGWRDPAERENTILVNAAYDRAGLRFGHDYGHFLGEMATAVTALGEQAEVKCVAHSLDDERIAFDLRREHGISLPVIPMYDFDNDAIRDVYARTKLVIGMRGHAGMIPFGCGTPIISLISHPKMAYFLADIERPEWGISVHDRHLGARLTERATELLADHAAAVADVHGRQQELWKVTEANAADLRVIVGR
ncbi:MULTISPECIES: glycosyltransferase [unclassified Streptomyces]|uniref:glycosyltransferase n=1 Tax=unclassified Streptomyces TaxID=2593676 RepID=UPI00081E9305|nr:MULTISPECIES: glycosyltransferase [unclassified Streptomyces]MYR95154.1 polysaccharide pyruvyl transferase family protein [Streptomyces sp. SID4937]SCD84962.1 Lipopolysaccharide biosynthesis protein, LPS:glycosyltransferase [Streptomyces sp. ScaeMP-e83]